LNAACEFQFQIEVLKSFDLVFKKTVSSVFLPHDRFKLDNLDNRDLFI